MLHSRNNLIYRKQRQSSTSTKLILIKSKLRLQAKKITIISLKKQPLKKIQSILRKMKKIQLKRMLIQPRKTMMPRPRKYLNYRAKLMRKKQPIQIMRNRNQNMNQQNLNMKLLKQKLVLQRTN